MTTQAQASIKQTPAATVAYIAMKGPYSKVGEAFGKLYSWMGRKGYVPSGPPCGVYFNAPGEAPEEELLWELQSPVAGNVAPTGPDKQGLGVKRVEAAQVATMMHRGPYEGVGEVYEALMAWIAGKGYVVSGPASEVYLNDPAKIAPAELLTEVRLPVQKQT